MKGNTNTTDLRVAEIEGDVNALEENIAKAVQGVYCEVTYTSATTSGSMYEIGTLSGVTNGKLTQRSQVLGCVVDKIEGNNTIDYKGIVTVLSNQNVRYYANSNNSRVNITFIILTNAL